MPLSWNNIRWNTGNLLSADKIPEKNSVFIIITGNYVVWYFIQTNGSVHYKCILRRKVW